MAVASAAKMVLLFGIHFDSWSRIVSPSWKWQLMTAATISVNFIMWSLSFTILIELSLGFMSADHTFGHSFNGVVSFGIVIISWWKTGWGSGYTSSPIWPGVGVGVGVQEGDGWRWGWGVRARVGGGLGLGWGVGDGVGGGGGGVGTYRSLVVRSRRRLLWLQTGSAQHAKQRMFSWRGQGPYSLSDLIWDLVRVILTKEFSHNSCESSSKSRLGTVSCSEKWNIPGSIYGKLPDVMLAMNFSIRFWAIYTPQNLWKLTILASVLFWLQFTSKRSQSGWDHETAVFTCAWPTGSAQSTRVCFTKMPWSKELISCWQRQWTPWAICMG